MNHKLVIIIAGPTASGKTSLAIELARHFQTAIISADSRQCFKEMNIGVAKPSAEQLQLVKHHFINSHSIQNEVNASIFEHYALHAANAIFESRDIAVMAGGTGLYLKAFCEGLDDIPAIPALVRNMVETIFREQGIDELQRQVQEKDPGYYASGEIQNPRRLMRALEVAMFSGKSIRDFQRSKPAQRNFRILKIGIQPAREALYQQINNRVNIMMEQGLLSEVMGLIPYRELNALQTVGYSELFDHLDGNLSLPEAVDRIKTNTRQYAKRQLTWFRKDPEMVWITNPGYQEAMNIIRESAKI
ncbi:MAG: tRNA (adenosine(37)-N6)-dimethylallyltransferase MiaA [Flavitalea sp.]